MNFLNTLISDQQIQELSVLSKDGSPLALETSDFWTTFDDSKIVESHPFNFFLRPEVPLALVILYLVGEFALGKVLKSMKVAMKGGLFSSLVTFHSAALTFYSLITFVHILPLVLSSANEIGWEATYCDRDGKLWNAGVGFWGTLFYLSKFWEFLDTVIIVLKGKSPSFLQVYHHAGNPFVTHSKLILCFLDVGVVIAMYLMVASRETGGIFTITILNSFIHTLMYAYYTLTALVTLPDG